MRGTVGGRDCAGGRVAGNRWGSPAICGGRRSGHARFRRTPAMRHRDASSHTPARSQLWAGGCASTSQGDFRCWRARPRPVTHTRRWPPADGGSRGQPQPRCHEADHAEDLTACLHRAQQREIRNWAHRQRILGIQPACQVLPRPVSCGPGPDCRTATDLRCPERLPRRLRRPRRQAPVHRAGQRQPQIGHQSRQGLACGGRVPRRGSLCIHATVDDLSMRSPTRSAPVLCDPTPLCQARPRASQTR